MMAETSVARVVKEALERYGLDTLSSVELAARIKAEWGVKVTAADITSMTSRLRRGLEKPRGAYRVSPENTPQAGEP
jgi:hypothetical protein